MSRIRISASVLMVIETSIWLLAMYAVFYGIGWATGNIELMDELDRWVRILELWTVLAMLSLLILAVVGVVGIMICLIASSLSSMLGGKKFCTLADFK